MPVNFKGTSEYNRNFHWIPSRKSASYQPTSQESNAVAGQPSSKLVLQMEPPLQTKKRVPTAKSDDHLAQEEYALLGKHEKFANNIRYKAKSKEPPLAKTYKVPVSMENGHENGHINGTSPAKPSHHQRSSHTKPSRGKSPAKPTKPTTHTLQQSKSADNVAGSGREHIVTPLAPREEKMAPQQVDKPSEVKKKSEPVQPKQSKSPPKRSKSAAPQVAQSEKKLESAEKPAPDSQAKTQNNQALKYKAGIAAPRHSRTRQSEYQLQYKWQNPMKSSPLLDAEQLVYSTHGPLPPFKSDPVPKFTEYRSQFKPYEYKITPSAVSQEKEAKLDKAQIKRSKSEGAIHKKVSEEKPKKDENKEKIHKARHPQQPNFPHGKHRRYKTEYAVNFKAPMNYEYEDGAWRGANPAHVIKDVETTEEPVSKSASSWFLEVMELRKKAKEYKLRARGTHFSKEHLAQLYAKQADYWDAFSSASDTVAALALDKPRSRPAEKRSVASETPRSLSAVSEGASTITPQMAHTGAAQPPQRRAEEISKYPVQRKLAWTEENQDEETPGDESSQIPSTGRSTTITTRSEATADDVGRIPTPKMSTINKPKGRHHLDLTTPAVHGALLASPPQAPPSSRSGSVALKAPVKIVPTAPVVPPTVQASSSEILKTPPQKQVAPSKVGTTPTFGKPTTDTHLLIHEELSHDEPVVTKFTRSPAQSRVQSKINMRKDPIRPAGIPSTLHEGMANTYNKPESDMPQPWDIDWRLKHCSQAARGDDALSISNQSIASSYMLASETLERARARNDEFWGKTDEATGR